MPSIETLVRKIEPTEYKRIEEEHMVTRPFLDDEYVGALKRPYSHNKTMCQVPFGFYKYILWRQWKESIIRREEQRNIFRPEQTYEIWEYYDIQTLFGTAGFCLVELNDNVPTRILETLVWRMS